MQKQIIKLREIVWEITGRCENRCDFCGSKSQWNEAIDEKNILDIANAISEYPPEEIDISGGDPLLVKYNVHREIVMLLKANKTKCKIVINPRSVNDRNKNENVNTLNLYDLIGVSINNKEDLEKFETFSSALKSHFTIITNFNTINLYSYQRIEEFVKKHNCAWMIQYTVFSRKYADEDNLAALYSKGNEDAFNFLQDKINESIKNNVKIIISDNASDGLCGAGRVACGILSNGDVIGCLSMRSWMQHSEMNEISEGNVLTTSLKDIWESGFGRYRFNEFKCCKDHCRNKCISNECSKPVLGVIDWNKIKILQNPNVVAVYYGVTDWRKPEPWTKPNVYAYSVIEGDSKWRNWGTGTGDVTPIYSVTESNGSTPTVKNYEFKELSDILKKRNKMEP